MRQWLTVAVFSLASALAHAAPPSDASLQELLKVSRADRIVDQLSGTIDSSMKKSMELASDGEKVSPSAQKQMDAARARFSQIMREELQWSRLEPVYMQIYRESLTQEDVNGMLQFYKSPAGQALIEKMPLIMEKSMQVTQEQIMPRLMQRLKEASAELDSSSSAARRAR